MHSIIPISYVKIDMFCAWSEKIAAELDIEGINAVHFLFAKEI